MTRVAGVREGRRTGDAARRAVWLPVASALLYAGLTLLYAPSVSYAPISLDDARHLQALSSASWAHILDADPFGHVRPVKNALFLLLARGGGDAEVLRSFVLLVFLASVAMVQRLSTRLCGSAAVGLFAAACWALHPIIASVVCWLSAANIALCGAGILVYVSCGRRALAEAPPRRPLPIQLAALAALLFALACYELALFAPIALALYARGADAAGPKHDRSRVLWVGSLLCVTAWIGWQLARDSGGVAYRTAEHPAWLLSASSMRYFLENAWLWLWPFGTFGVLRVDRPAEHVVQSVLSWVMVLALAAVAFRYLRRERAIAFGLGWFALFLLPLCNLLPLGNTPVAMHYLYVPSVGLALALARGATLVLAHVPWPRELRRPAVAAVLVAALFAALLPQTQHAVAAFASAEQLYARSREHDPDNVEVLVNLAGMQLRRGAHAEARAVLSEAAKIAPTDPGVLRNRYALLFETGQLEQALQLTETPTVRELPEFLIRKGEVLERLERHAEAGAAFERALARSADPHERLIAGYHLALALLRTGQRARAEVLIERLLEEFPGQQELLFARRLLQASSAPAHGQPSAGR